MPALNPFAKNALRIFKKTTYYTCDPSKDLISVVYDEGNQRYKLHMNEPKIKCCYKAILRNGNGAEADNEFK